MTYMRRRFAIAALASLAVAALPATAAAATPEEAARAFADAALGVQTELAAATAQLKRLDDPPACRIRAPRRHRAEVAELKTMLHVAHTIAGFTRAAGPALLSASTRLHAVETSDPALLDGRTAWRRLRRTYAGFAELPAGDACAEVRAFARNGYRHTRATRRTVRAFHAMMAWDTSDVDRRMDRAVERLVELGVPAAEADAFDGELGE
jgi:hypothetical protein